MVWELNAMDTAFDTEQLPEAFATCACCVRESLDAAGLSLDCAPDHQDPEREVLAVQHQFSMLWDQVTLPYSKPEEPAPDPIPVR